MATADVTATIDGRSSVSLNQQGFAVKRLTDNKVWIESPFTKNELDVIWIPQRTSLSQQPLGYNVYRSKCATMILGGSEVTKLNTSLIQTTSFRDTNVDLLQREVYYYVVTEVFDQEVTITIKTAMDFQDYTAIVNGTPSTIPSGLGATFISIRDALIASLNLNPERVFAKATRDNAFILTTTVSGQSFTTTVSPTADIELVSQIPELLLDEPRTINTHVGGPHGRRRKNISMPRIFREFKRRKYIIFHNNSEDIVILLRKRAGVRCACYSCDYESAGAGCDTCFGTGFEGGYCILRAVELRFLSVQELLSLQPAGLQFKSNPRGWLVDFPVLSNGDVVVRSNNYRYEIQKLDIITHQGVLTEQNFDLIALDTTSPIYDFTIPVP